MAEDGFVEVHGANRGNNVILQLFAVALMVTGPIVYTANGGGTVGIVLKGPDVKPGNKLVAAVDPDDHRDFELDH